MQVGLISWKSSDVLAPGNFTFQLDQEGVNQFIVWKRSTRYWKSGVSGRFIGPDGKSSAMPSENSYLLSNFTSPVFHNESMPHLSSELYQNTWLVMSSSGEIEYLKCDSAKIWSLISGEHRDQCSRYNACGSFGICNSNNDLKCKCLLGFAPSSPSNLNSRDFSSGCTRKSRFCNEKDSDGFLMSNIVEVGNLDSQFKAENENGV